jgi:predicted nucleotidyltransferase
MTDLYDVLRQIVQLLEELQIQYVVMGGLAVRVHGIPRPTHDIDFTLAVGQSDLLQFFDRLEQQGLTVPDAYRTGWRDRVADMPLVKARLYLQGRGIDIDMFLVESQFQESLMSRRQRVVVEGINLWLVTPEDLILLKLLADRPRDRGDIGDVFFMQGQLDVDYMRRWAKELGVEEKLDQAIVDSAAQ